MTLAERFEPKRNSLNFIRLMLATAVIVSHARPLGGFGRDPEIAGQALGTWAVMGFFAISGFLIASSRSHTDLFSYFVRRVLRIYPGFVVCIVVVAFAFAPLSVLWGGGRYSLSSGVGYVARNGLLKVEQPGIAHTLTNVPYASAWDGSLWTLFYEFSCYIVIGVLLCTTVRLRRPLAVAAFVVSAAGGQYAVHYPLPTVAEDFFMLAPVFFGGALVYLFGDRIPFDWRLGLLCIVALPIATQAHLMPTLGALAAGYAYLFIGVVLPFHAIGRRNDISYGVYIYAFPVQQSLVLLHLNRHGWALYALVSIVVTVPFAAASWFLIERKALALKRLFTQRTTSLDTSVNARAAIVVDNDTNPVSST
jgi:peptidoglycan/LPS O-acetylase OafA/YrhL